MVVLSVGGSTCWYGLLTVSVAVGSWLGIGLEVDEMLESSSELSVRKESSESSHGVASLVAMRMRILIACAEPL